MSTPQEQMMEAAILERYGIATTIRRTILGPNEYKVIIAHGDKFIVLREVLKQGVTQKAYLTKGKDVERDMPTYNTAEEVGIAWLKGEE